MQKKASRDSSQTSRHRYYPRLGERTREALIKLNYLIIVDAVFMVSNIRGGQHGNPALTMTVEDYMAQMDYAVLPLHNPSDYPYWWGPPKRKFSKPKDSNKIKHCSEYSLPLTEQLKSIFSRRCNQSYCNHWWNS